MNKTVINIKIDKNLKEEAQKVAKELGLGLGTIINAYLRELTREKRVVFSVFPEPNDNLKKLLKKIKSEKNNSKKISSSLNYKEAINYLNNL